MARHGKTTNWRTIYAIRDARELTIHEAALLSVVAQRGICKTTRERLCGDCKFSDGTLTKVSQSLQDKGLLRVHQGGYKRQAWYEVDDQAMAEWCERTRVPHGEADQKPESTTHEMSPKESGTTHDVSTTHEMSTKESGGPTTHEMSTSPHDVSLSAHEMSPKGTEGYPKGTPDSLLSAGELQELQELQRRESWGLALTPEERERRLDLEDRRAVAS